ncbi:MAG: hypothetical protein R2939_05320 [Kofleriaceae bacterium]
MLRPSRRTSSLTLVTGVAALVAGLFDLGAAHAQAMKPGRTLVPSPEDAPEGPHAVYIIDDTLEAVGDVSNIIFLNRCVGGCTITGTENRSDARTNESSIPMPGSGTFNVAEFAYTNEDWDELVACVQKVYAPYDVVVTDVDPGQSVIHHEAIVAGISANIGWPPDVLGVGTVAGDCSPYDNGISFSFANAHASMQDLCHTVAQESAHTYGLDHELECSDPRTYLEGCGPKFFRNLNAVCGEFSARPCRCSGAQNSHVSLNAVFGPNPTPLPAPTASVVSPSDGATVTSGFSVFVQATHDRGFSAAELWINGYRWAVTTEDDFTKTSGTYTLATPPSVPDGIMDLEVRVYDDLHTVYGSAELTVTKGAPCTSAASCSEGQQCEEGRCFWDPPTAELGAACEYDEFCLSGECRDDGSGAICTQACITGTANACPTGLECTAAAGTSTGYCFLPGEDGGCCSAGDRGVAGRFAIAGLVVAFVLGGGRRRRRVAA